MRHGAHRVAGQTLIHDSGPVWNLLFPGKPAPPVQRGVAVLVPPFRCEFLTVGGEGAPHAHPPCPGSQLAIPGRASVGVQRDGLGLGGGPEHSGSRTGDITVPVVPNSTQNLRNLIQALGSAQTRHRRMNFRQSFGGLTDPLKFIERLRFKVKDPGYTALFFFFHFV